MFCIDAWKDLLTEYNGQAISYDTIGNPLTYRDGMSFGWSAGRTLTSFILNNGASYVNGEYVYDDNGIRVYKNINGNETEYYLDGSTILTEITNFGGITRRIDYIYDEAGSIYGFSVDGVDYYYVRNWQGDIIGILDKTGNLLVEYVYDAYGVPTVSFPGITEGMTDAEKQAIYLLGNNNPFRYRGYYFDVESGLYYLNSRYYDPVTGRFINADDIAFLGTGGLTSYNLFAYCGNNPVMNKDSMGESITVVVIILVSATLIGAIIGATSKTSYVDNVRKSNEKKQKSQKIEQDNEVNKNPNALPGTSIRKPTEEIEPPKPTLTIKDRVVNTLIGAGVGLSVGGLVLVGAAAGAVVFAGGTVFGMAAGQVFAIGALAYNVFPIVIAPFFGMESEPLEL